jgi:hypothetical protein
MQTLFSAATVHCKCNIYVILHDITYILPLIPILENVLHFYAMLLLFLKATSKHTAVMAIGFMTMLLLQTKNVVQLSGGDNTYIN